MGPRDLADSFKVSLVRQDGADVSHHRLEDDGGDVPAPGDEVFERVQVVVGDLPGACGDLGEHPGRVRDAERGGPGPGLHQHAVMGAMEPPLYLYDLLLPRESPGQPDRSHGCLGAARYEPYHVEAGVVPDKKRGILRFNGGGSPVKPPLLQLCRHGSPDRRVGMAENQGAVCHAAVYQFLPIHCPDPRSGSLECVERVRPDCADRTAHAPRHQSLCLQEVLTALHQATPQRPVQSR